MFVAFAKTKNDCPHFCKSYYLFSANCACLVLAPGGHLSNIKVLVHLFLSRLRLKITIESVQVRTENCPYKMGLLLLSIFFCGVMIVNIPLLVNHFREYLSGFLVIEESDE